MAGGTRPFVGLLCFPSGRRWCSRASGSLSRPGKGRPSTTSSQSPPVHPRGATRPLCPGLPHRGGIIPTVGSRLRAPQSLGTGCRAARHRTHRGCAGGRRCGRPVRREVDLHIWWGPGLGTESRAPLAVAYPCCGIRARDGAGVLNRDLQSLLEQVWGCVPIGVGRFQLRGLRPVACSARRSP